MADKTSSLTNRQMADLSALADGTLPPDRRTAVEAWVAASPELQQLLDRQRRSVAATQAAATEPAPARLRAAVQAQVAARRRRRVRRVVPRLALAGAAAGAAGVAQGLARVGGGPPFDYLMARGLGPGGASMPRAPGARFRARKKPGDLPPLTHRTPRAASRYDSPAMSPATSASRNSPGSSA